MKIANHQKYLIPLILLDSEIAEIANICASQWLDLCGNDHIGLNAAMAHIEPDSVILFAKEMGSEMHAGYRVIRDGIQTDFRFERRPLLSHDQALGEALRMWDESTGEHDR